MTITYLASPYTHDDPEVMEQRFQDVCKVAAELMREGRHVFSPIAHSHPIAQAGKLPVDWEFWKGYCIAMLSACSDVTVLMLNGWEDSKGIEAETQIAKELGLPIYYQFP